MKRLAHVLFLCGLSLSMSLMATAETSEQQFESGSTYGESQVSSGMSAMQGFNPNEAFGSTYTATPPETAYTDNDAAIAAAAPTAAANDPASQAVVESFMTNPDVTIAQSTLKEGEAIETAAPAIVNSNDVFCSGGQCKSTTTTPSQDFGADGSALSGASSAGTDVQEEVNGYQFQFKQIAQNVPVTSFSGASTECTHDAVSFNNCCADSGWGKQAGLAHCSTAEKQLGLAKQEHRVIYVGQYCSKKIPLVGCVEKKYVYCQFHALLDRIYQEDGRWGQLHRNFGTVNDDNHTANCSGLSPDDLTRLHFDECDATHPSPNCMHYDEYFQQLESQMAVPSASSTAAEVNKTLEEYYG